MKVFRITTSTTTTLTDKSGSMRWLRLVVTGTPTAWIIKVQNKESPAKIFHVTDGLNASSTIEVPFPQQGDKPAPVEMTNGIDIVTSGTAGVLDAWLEWRKSENQ